MNTRHLIAAAALATLGAAASAQTTDAYLSGRSTSASFAGEAYGTQEPAAVDLKAAEERLAMYHDTTPQALEGEAYGTVAAADLNTLPANDPVAIAATYSPEYGYEGGLFRANDAYGAQPMTLVPVADDSVAVVIPTEETVTLQPGEALLIVPVEADSE
jgi:hypothetical protein